MLDLSQEPVQAKVLDRSQFGGPKQLNWSSDGRWLAYDHADTSRTRAIRVCELESLEVHQITQPVLSDSYPAFDPGGEYLYFIGQREFQTLRDDVGFGLGTPTASRLYALGLRKGISSPFLHQRQRPESQAVVIHRKAEAELTTRSSRTEIDFEGLEHRIWPFPLRAERYSRLDAVEGKVFFLEGESLAPGENGGGVERWTLEYFDMETRKRERLVNKWIDAFTRTPDGRTLLCLRNRTLRVLNSREKYCGPDSDSANPQTGWIDLARVKVFSHPAREFPQMFREAWRLQRDHFWKGDMNGLDWDEVYDRYRPLVDRVNTRSEFSDLLHELLGELGTSHAYDYFRAEPRHVCWQGFLGADFEADPENPELYRCSHIVEGAPWLPRETSPLLQCAQVGDRILAINGLPVKGVMTPADRLLNQGGQKVRVTLQSPGEEPRQEVVKALYCDEKARYRDWVRKNREEVARRTEGRVGYIHIPDMSCQGFAEFRRDYLAQCDREALIIDVRFNGGGRVSELILEKLAQRRIGYVFPRWGAPRPYPLDSPGGPLVGLTNEQAGSDGDIFSHGFKLKKLGPLVGKRTWGGTVGIAPRYGLVDDTVTSQPEYSFFFDDVGWELENNGTDPDIEVDNTPKDYLLGQDPQLLKSIEVALDQLKEESHHTSGSLPCRLAHLLQQDREAATRIEQNASSPENSFTPSDGA